MKYKVCLLILFAYCSSSVAQQPAISAVDSNTIKTLFFAGLRDKLNENYSRANESFNKILSVDPNNAAVYYEIATLSYRQNKLYEAEAAIRKAVALDADNLWYWKLLAELYKRKGDMESLVGVFDQMIRLSPETEAYYFDRSNAWLLAGNTDKALAGYDELEKKFGASTALTQARQRISLGSGQASGKQDIDKILAEDLGDVKNHLDLSAMLMEKGQNDAALAILKKAKLSDPESYEVDLALADVYKNLKKDNEAINALKRAFANTMMPAVEKVKIVMMLLDDGKKGEAIKNAAELVQIAIKAHPEEPGVMAAYGTVLYRQGNLSAALAEFQAVLKITDQLYGVWEQVLNIQIGLGQYKEAIKTGDTALSIYPNQAILYYYMALAFHHDNQNDQALTNVKLALQLDGENGVYLEFYGDIAFLNGDRESALTYWKKAKIAGNDSEKLNRKINEQKYIL